MPLYKVRVWTTVYVEADTESHAQEVADKDMNHILQSESEWEVETDYEVTAARDVRHGWTLDSLPYTDDVVPIRTIQEILENP